MINARMLRAADVALLTVGLLLYLPFTVTAATQLSVWGDNFGTAPTEATNIVAIAGGDGHVVVLRADGRVFAWGRPDYGYDYGQTNVPPDVTNAVRIAAGSTHSLALLDDGTVRFWGNIYTTGVTNPPLSAAANMVVLAQGGTAQHVLSVRSDGTAVDWGNSSYGLGTVPAKATNVVDAAAASFHALVLRADGTPVAWGLYGTYPPYGAPVVPANATNVVAVAAGFSHDLALRADGSLVGWGTSSSEAFIPAEATNITAIACGGGQRLVLRADGKLLAWYSGGQTSAIPSGLSNVVAIAATTVGYLALSASDGPPLLGRIPHTPIAAGTTARVRALAISTTPLSYQWMCDGTNLPGATTATLVLSNAQPSQTGAYALIVRNAFGAVTNSDLNFSVPPLLIQTPPQSQTVAGGTNTTFGVTAIGQGPFRYQWQTNGVALAGATTNSLVLTNVQMNQAGSYSVIVSNAFGTVTSPNAMLGVVPLFITSQPQNQSTYVGGQASFNVTATGKGPFGYQWQASGTNLPSATNNPLVLTNVQFSGAGPYSVTVSNAFGAVQSSNAFLTVVPILITAQPQNQAGFLGQTINFAVTAQASLPLSYQWQFNGADLLGATTSSLTLTNCQYSRTGIYRVVMNTAVATTNCTDTSLAVTQVASWGSQGQATVPAGLSNLVAVAGGAYHSIALKADRTLVRWGDNTNVPSDLTNVMTVAAGGYHDLALKADGTVVGWGQNSSGQINVPSGLTKALAVAAGGTHSLALKPDGGVVAWGGNSSGQTNVPPDLTNVIAIAAGEAHSLALRAEGRVVAWGSNANGQTNVPNDLSNVVAVAGGWVYSFALKADGRVVAWGSPSYGILDVPASATNVVAIAAGWNHCQALKSDGTVLAWGTSSYGATALPGDLKNVVGIGEGGQHSLALVSDGTTGPKAPLVNPAWGPGGFRVSVPTISGKVYLLEYKNALADSNWTGLPLAAGNGGVITLTDPTANGSQRFYRVRQW